MSSQPVLERHILTVYNPARMDPMDIVYDSDTDDTSNGTPPVKLSEDDLPPGRFYDKFRLELNITKETFEKIKDDEEAMWYLASNYDYDTEEYLSEEKGETIEDMSEDDFVYTLDNDEEWDGGETMDKYRLQYEFVGSGPSKFITWEDNV